jgi:hypothetical protein
MAFSSSFSLPTFYFKHTNHKENKTNSIGTHLYLGHIFVTQFHHIYSIYSLSNGLAKLFESKVTDTRAFHWQINAYCFKFLKTPFYYQKYIFNKHRTEL